MVYGYATPVIVEWRSVRDEFLKTLKTGTVLDRTEVQEQMLELEIAMIEEHELTLPPRTYPWDEFDRRDQVWERRQDIKRVRVSATGRCCGGGCAGSLPWGCGGNSLPPWALNRSNHKQQDGQCSYGQRDFTSCVVI